MPFEQFDRSQLKLKPLGERVHDLTQDVMQDPDNVKCTMDHPTIDLLAERIIAAREKGATVLMAMGAHCLRAGNGPLLAELARRGLITHFALNGAGAIHDFEFAMIGATTESVAKYISEGQFGLWAETGRINDIIKEGVQDGLGWGEALGRYIWEEHLPHREKSVLAMGYHLQVPCTVHIGVGNDIIHEHPNCDGAAMGKASYTDFLIYAQSVTGLEHGVFLNFGSAVAGPEVYLKALAMARNVAKQEGRQIAHFTTAVFDLLDIEGSDYSAAPPKTDPRYYFRPWKTILARTVADGGVSHYIRGEHQRTVPALARKILELDSQRK